MADDIDIEEHDVLDNPKLKNIFPDITHIKTEVVDYDEEENDFEYPEVFINPNQEIKEEPIEYESRDISNIHRNVIILGSKPSTPQSCSNISTPIHETSVNVENTSDDEDPEILPCSVVLEDWSILLSNNPCYCSECQVLFPTVNAIDFHRMTAHSFLVAVSNNKAIKSTSKSSIEECNPIKENLRRIELLCKHCNIYYPDEITLIKHKYSLIPHTCSICKEVFSDEESLKSHQIVHSIEENLYIVCTLCSCVFKQENSYMGHISLNHGNPKIDRVMTPFNKKCKHCKKSISLPKNYNAHIRISHADFFFMKQNSENLGQVQCHICKLTFPSAYSERVHRATKHPTNMKSYDLKARRAIESYKNIDKRVVPKLKSNKNVHMKIPIPKSHLDKNVNMKVLIPKSHLFKCNKCQIHFLSCYTAIEHSRHCTLRKGDWKCNSCRRMFKLEDREIHTQQHALTERFKVIIVAEDIVPRILNKCGLCNICFDERTFSKHHASGCRQSQSVECGVCHLLIHEFSVSKHLKYHRELNIKLNDFIINDYFTVDNVSKAPDSASSSVDSVPVKHKRVIRLPSYKTLYFCPNCQCYTSRSRLKDGHHNGDCRRRPLKELCKLCGLQFTKKAILSHRTYHKMYQIKLTDITFFNLLTGKKIIPPFPEFQFCSMCRVHFFSTMALKNHVCNTEEHKSCKQCMEKFSDLALKLHLPFHQYSNSLVSDVKRPITATGAKRSIAGTVTKIPTTTGVKRSIAGTATSTPHATTGAKRSIAGPGTKGPILDLIKKYESLETIWNVLFRCQTCDIVLDCYDSVVEHCQDHYCNMENYNVNISYCKKCKLKFVDKCYSRHEHLHLENNINIESFVIIDYDFSVLLSDDWLKIFDRLSKDQIQQILSLSVYNEIRGVRMELLSDGTLGSIYKCSLCDHAIDIQSIVDHVRHRDCENTLKKNMCSYCDVAFIRKNSSIAHENKHNINNEPFRIISFNDNKDTFINEALIKHTKADDLKFVRCQHCGKLINKVVYKRHIYKHNYREKMKLIRNGLLKATEPVAMRLKHKYDMKILFHFYVCKKCGVAMLKGNIKRHICCEEHVRKMCNKCHLFFRSCHLWKHYKIHEKYPKLSRKTISLTYINNATDSVTKTNTIIENNAIEDNASVENNDCLEDGKKMLRFYECILCQTCVSVSNTRRHTCMTRRSRAKCELCGIHVHASHLWQHKTLHKKFTFSRKNIIIVKFKGKHKIMKNNVTKHIQNHTTENKTLIKRYKKQIDAMDKSSDTDTNSDILSDTKFDYMRVYKCTRCNLFFISKQSLIEHIIHCKDVCDFEEGTKCEICNLSFHPSNIKSHKAVQKCNERNISLINICTLIFNDSDVHDKTNWLYYCKQCDFYSLNAMRHHYGTQHKTIMRKIPCTTCGVKFGSICYRKHLNLHHNERNVPFSKLNIAVLEDYTLDEAGYVPQTPDNTFDSTQLTVDDESVDDNVKPTVAELFRCPTCNCHFLTKKTAWSHQSRGDHNLKAVPCVKCDRPFSRISLHRHLRFHNKITKYIVTDFYLKEKLSFDVSNSSIEEGTSKTIETNSSSFHEVSSNNKETLSSNSQMISTDEINQTTSSDRPTDSNNEIKETMNSNPHNVSKQTMSSNLQTASNNEIKLFKCSECDVYFLTAESCYDHTYNHSPLDPTEYIACKICDLQFLCESLGKHMKCHREKIFNMDELVVDEYQPHGKNVKIDTYSANDRLKSKLVSTTTHSDND